MSYPRDIEDYRDEELEQELKRRKESREKGLCDYCHNPPLMKACKYPERHILPPNDGRAWR